MTESKAVEDYNAFDSLRNRFGGATKSPSEHLNAHQQRKSSKKKFDPRSNAPPLVPLVEESDSLQQELKAHSGTTSPVKGKWKHSNGLKANGPDFDALETASITSCSSAYSSRSESGIFSPNGGSVTELSDVGSCDTFLEYDITKKPQKPIQSRTAFLRSTFEKSKSFDIADTRFSQDLDIEVPDDFVNGRKKAWNKFIGEWVFNGISKPVPSPPADRLRRISNEVRVPTPSSTPVFGSTENLNDSGSRCSLLSSIPDDESEEEQQPSNWTPEKWVPGRFVNSAQRKRPSSASNLSRRLQMIHHQRSLSDLDLVEWEEPSPVEERGGVVSPLVKSSKDKTPPVPSAKPRQPVSPSKTEQVAVAKQEEPVKQVLEDIDEFKALQKITPAKSSRWLKAYQKYKSVKDEQELVKPVKQVPIAKTDDNKEEEREKPTPPPARSTKWQDAIQKYKNMRDTQSSKVEEKQAPEEKESPQLQTSEEPAFSTSVEQRAKRFGGMQRKPLRRTQSFQVSSTRNYDTHKIRTPYRF